MDAFPSPTATYRKTIYDAISPTRPELSMRGKSVVITGAGTGIGAETARRFAEAGASRIALLGRREQPLVDTKASILAMFPDVDVFTASADVTKKSEVDDAFERFAGAGASPINVLISNAAIAGPLEPVKDVNPAAFLDAVQQNLGGHLHVSQAFLRFAAPAAVAVVVSTVHAYANVVPGLAAYSVSKMATFRLWDSVAFANPDLTVFHVNPGIVDTPGSRSVGGGDTYGQPDDVSLSGGFMVWLASPEATFLKNKFVWANWDVDELIAQKKEIESGTKLNIGIVGWPFQDN